MSDQPSPTPAPAPTGNASQTATPSAGLTPAAGFAPDVVADAKADVAAWAAEDAADRQHADQAVRVLKSTLGNDFGDFVRVLSSYERGLSDSERDALYEPLPSGKLKLNDPKTALQLVGKALDEIPPLKAAVAQYGSEKAAIEEMMKQRGGPYWKGPYSAALQLKYRALHRA